MVSSSLCLICKQEGKYCCKTSQSFSLKHTTNYSKSLQYYYDKILYEKKKVLQISYRTSKIMNHCEQKLRKVEPEYDDNNNLKSAPFIKLFLGHRQTV